MSISENNIICASASVVIFIYYQLLTFALGYIALPCKKYFIRNSPINILVFWLFGFGLLNCVVIGLASAGYLNRLTQFLSNIAFFLIIAFNRKALISLSTYFSNNYKNYPLKLSIKIFIILFTLLAISMFLSCLAPPTKADDITYGIYYTKKLMLDGQFKQFYSPYEALTYLAVPIYNTWCYSSLTEFAPALNSFFYYVLSTALIFFWSASRFGNNVAILSCLVCVFAMQKTVTCVAPGDNSLNYLLVMAFMMATYDFYIEAEKSKYKVLTNDMSGRLFALYLFSFMAVVVKPTSIFLIAPTLLFFHIFLFKKHVQPAKHLLIATAAFSIATPFFLKQFILFHNFLFPLAIGIFGAGPFDALALKVGLRSHLVNSPINCDLTFLGLLKSPFLYFKADALFMNPLAYPLIILGYKHLLRLHLYYAALAFFICYITAFFYIPHYFSRFYLGAMDFLIILGLVEIFQMFSKNLKEYAVKVVFIVTFLAALLVTVCSIVYNSQFISYLILNESREKFLKNKIECLDTIRWANENLPKNGLLVTATRGRYYFDLPTESFDPTVFGKRKNIIQNSKEFYDYLKQKGVTHIMLLKRFVGANKSANSPFLTSPYVSFWDNVNFFQLIYKNENEIVQGFRSKKPLYGTTTIYRIK